MFMQKPARAGAFAVALLAGGLLAGCAGLEAKLAAFEAKAAPAIARGCATFHAAEASPLVQMGIGLGTSAINVATGVPVAGLAVSAIKGFGDRFCAEGPPAGDASTPDQQAAWLAGLPQQLVGAAEKLTGR
jgi:hypothetical protein